MIGTPPAHAGAQVVGCEEVLLVIARKLDALVGVNRVGLL